jgi:hypothetical protein
MASENVRYLLDYVLHMPIGHKFTIATSQYANNTTEPGFRFDQWSTAPAVRSLVNRGFIKAEYGWRYYDAEVISHTEEK